MTKFAPQDVPTATFISHFVLNEAIGNERTLHDSTRIVCQQFGVTAEQVHPLKEIRLLSWLYCFLVFPSELWRREKLTYSQITNFLLVLGRAFHEAQQVKDATFSLGQN